MQRIKNLDGDGTKTKIVFTSPKSDTSARVVPLTNTAYALCKANIGEMPDELLGRAMSVAKKVAVAMKEGLSCDGVNVVQNNGEAAGQTVFHFHIHHFYILTLYSYNHLCLNNMKQQLFSFLYYFL